MLLDRAGENVPESQKWSYDSLTICPLIFSNDREYNPFIWLMAMLP